MSGISPDEAKSLADKVIQAEVIPPKIPDIDDVEGQTKALGGALASSLLTATEMPLHMLQPVVGALAAQLVALGIRQTDRIDPDAIHAPAWVTDGMRQQSVKLPDPPDHHSETPYVARTATAPPIPDEIAHHERAVRL